MKTILFTLSLFLSSTFFSQKYEIYVYDISSHLCDSEVSKEFCMIQPDTVENCENLNMKYILDFDSGQMTFYEFSLFMSHLSDLLRKAVWRKKFYTFVFVIFSYNY